MIVDAVNFLKLLPQRWRILKYMLKEITCFPTLVKALWMSVFLAVLSRSSMRLTHKDAPGYLLEPTEMPHRDNTECCVCQAPLSFILPAAGHLSDNGLHGLYPHGPQQKQLLPPGSHTLEGSHMQ